MVSILIGLIVALTIQAVLLIPAIFFKTDKLTDFAYGFTFMVLAVLFTFPNQFNYFKILLMVIILVWALRLTMFLFARITKLGKDSRFDKIRDNPLKFGIFFLIQGIVVWIIMLPAMFFFNTEVVVTNPYIIAGIVIWTLGLFIESLADNQKFNFKNRQENKDKWTNIGLWKYSRHPNYFGEILIWIGIYVYTISSITEWHYALISPIIVYLTLRFFTGIPPLEKLHDEKFGKIPEYQMYKKQTNALIPWFRKKTK